MTFKINMSLKLIEKMSSKMGCSKTKLFKTWINTFQKLQSEKKNRKRHCN